MACVLTAGAAAAANPPLKIYNGDRRTDTVYTAKHYLIGVTEPGATAYINGKEAHVYRTGSFGAEVTLSQGDNNIPVTVRTKGGTTDTNVHLVLAQRPAAASTAPEETFTLPEPVAVTTTEGAYLQYGNGGDRLGGSKMGFIDAGIPLTAVGETRNLYKVALGQQAFAYVPKEYVNAGGEGMKVYNTGSTSVSNIGTADRVAVSLPGRLPYSSYTEIDPSTIVVKLYGATNNTNWLTQRNTPGMIDYVDLRQDESDVLSLIIHLKEKYQWGYSIAYDGNVLNIDVRHRPASLELKDLTIGLDAGHGGPYPGAHSPSGLTEKEVNLDIVLKLADILRKKGANVVLTRSGDTGPSMTERKNIWREAGVNLAVSVHNNASGNPLIPMGTSSYYKHLFSRALAQNLHSSMLELGLANFGLTGNFNFSLNGPTDFPNALVEVLFMSSLPDEEMLADPEMRTRLAQQIAKGIENYLAQVKASL